MTATVTLVDDANVIANFIPAADRPVGQTATARELGAREDGDVIHWDAQGYVIADSTFPVIQLTYGPFAAALKAGGFDQTKIVAFVAKKEEAEGVRPYSEVWAVFDETGNGLYINEDAVLTRII